MFCLSVKSVLHPARIKGASFFQGWFPVFSTRSFGKGELPPAVLPGYREVALQHWLCYPGHEKNTEMLSINTEFAWWGAWNWKRCKRFQCFTKILLYACFQRSFTFSGSSFLCLPHPRPRGSGSVWGQASHSQVTQEMGEERATPKHLPSNPKKMPHWRENTAEKDRIIISLWHIPN